MRIMGTEGIACYKDFVLHDISIHGIGPVQVRQHEEFQRFIANLHFVAIFYRNAVKIAVDDIFQKANRNRCRNDFCTGILFQYFCDTARMVRLGVVYHNVVNRCNIQRFGKRFFILIIKFCLCRFKQHGFVTAFKDIGIVGRSKFRIHNDVEYPQILVQYSSPIKIRLQGKCFHEITSLIFLDL